MVEVKFAIEKKMYSNMLQELVSIPEDQGRIMTILIKMQTIEEIIKANNDAIITVVSTQLTYDGNAIVAPMDGPFTAAEKETVPEGVVPIEEMPVIKNPVELKKIADEELAKKEVVDEFKPEPSPPCNECYHKEISHNKDGCRYCNCKVTRPKK